MSELQTGDAFVADYDRAMRAAAAGSLGRRRALLVFYALFSLVFAVFLIVMPTSLAMSVADFGTIVVMVLIWTLVFSSFFPMKFRYSSVPGGVRVVGAWRRSTFGTPIFAVSIATIAATIIAFVITGANAIELPTLLLLILLGRLAWGYRPRNLPFGVVLQPEGVLVQGCGHLLAWDELTLERMHIGQQAPGALELRLVRLPGETHCITMGAWQFIVVCQYFRLNPQDRGILTTSSGPGRVESLCNYPVAPGASAKPAWLRPPPASWL